ncbi:MAG: extracellular solute-binding protein [SAR324 cluster bacterium]|nr:iron ABC transporter substrate-binding protein [Dehalococcoidales bacterium]MDP6092502.1 extracellular solute-binding protein [SAR324 cluster bacterium]MDP6248714.1 extracellular solute-binding protein [SAR324 cluster bacterium]MDP6464662.1 extracellular solute-binding protein [SAR324 cluster bacterium]MDP7140085.1 extracellular solute-binding protein [SAR324 cluster bacterium]|tara:strand:- start:8188 stop:9219 length:1032 start_codon:yes stop_codon:yes gene_type:complete
MKSLFKTFISMFMIVVSTSAMGMEVNILSERQEFLLKPFLDQFEKDTEIKANVVYMKKGGLERIKAQPGAIDVVLTVDISNLTKMNSADLFQQYESRIVDKNVPKHFRGPNGKWTALTARARIIYHSRERVKPSDLSTYEALSDPKFKGRVCIRSGYHNYNLALISSVIITHGPSKAKKWLKGLKANLARKPQGNDRGQVKAIYSGLCDVSIGNTYYMGKMLDNPDQRGWANSVGIFFPNQNDRGTHMNVSGGAIIKTAKNVEEARKLLEFLSSDLAQFMYAQVNHEYPVNSDIQLSSIVRSFGSKQEGIKKGVFKKDRMDLSQIGSKRPEAVKLLDEVGFDL